MFVAGSNSVISMSRILRLEPSGFFAGKGRVPGDYNQASSVRWQVLALI
jgi:hypothetical protein